MPLLVSRSNARNGHSKVSTGSSEARENRGATNENEEGYRRVYHRNGARGRVSVCRFTSDTDTYTTVCSNLMLPIGTMQTHSGWE